MPPPSSPPDSRPAVSRHPADEPEDPFARKRRRNRARLIARTWLEDPELCSRCGTRKEVLAAISSPAQDDVIEKILRARGEWDPPWKRSRKVRGPPAKDDWPEDVDHPHPEFEMDSLLGDGGEG